ncbi:MAG: hypothetical protein AAB113_04295 [Candidatus Eisenbacteria bacterium]
MRHQAKTPTLSATCVAMVAIAAGSVLGLLAPAVVGWGGPSSSPQAAWLMVILLACTSARLHQRRAST